MSLLHPSSLKISSIEFCFFFLYQREGTWGVISEKIAFANFNFVVSYHHLRTKKKPVKNNTKQTEGQSLLESVLLFNVLGVCHFLNQFDFIVSTPGTREDA